MGELADALVVEALERRMQGTIEGPALPAVRQAISQAVEESLARHISRLEHTIRTSGPQCALTR